MILTEEQKITIIEILRLTPTETLKNLERLRFDDDIRPLINAEIERRKTTIPLSGDHTLPEDGIYTEYEDASGKWGSYENMVKSFEGGK